MNVDEKKCVMKWMWVCVGVVVVCGGCLWRVDGNDIDISLDPVYVTGVPLTLFNHHRHHHHSFFLCFFSLLFHCVLDDNVCWMTLCVMLCVVWMVG